MSKPNERTKALLDLIDKEFEQKGYIRWPFVESFLDRECTNSFDDGWKKGALAVLKYLKELIVVVEKRKKPELVASEMSKRMTELEETYKK